MMFDLHIMSRAAKTAFVKSAAPLPTMGLAPAQQGAQVDVLAHMAGQAPGANPAHINELANYYKTREALPSAQAAQQQLTHAAARTRAATAPASVAASVRKATTTAPVGNVLSHATQAVGPQRAVAGAVQHGLPVAGSASVLDHLMHAGGSALGFVGKHAGLADRGYMHEAVNKAKSKISPQDALRYGLPAMYGGLSGAEAMPDNKILGGLAGASGAVAGSELGGRAGRVLGRNISGTSLGETFGELLGRLAGGSHGSNLAVRGARLLVH